MIWCHLDAISREAQICILQVGRKNFGEMLALMCEKFSRAADTGGAHERGWQPLLAVPAEPAPGRGWPAAVLPPRGGGSIAVPTPHPAGNADTQQSYWYSNVSDRLRWLSIMRYDALKCKQFGVVMFTNNQGKAPNLMNLWVLCRSTCAAGGCCSSPRSTWHLKPLHTSSTGSGQMSISLVRHPCPLQL